jgi:hypothetical protein
MLVHINWNAFLGRNREFWDQFVSKLQEKIDLFFISQCQFNEWSQG